MTETNPQKDIYWLCTVLYANYSHEKCFSDTDIQKTFQVGITIHIVQKLNQINLAIKRDGEDSNLAPTDSRVSGFPIRSKQTH